MAEDKVSITLRQMPRELWQQFKAAVALKGGRLETELPEAVKLYLAAQNAQKGAKK